MPCRETEHHAWSPLQPPNSQYKNKDIEPGFALANQVIHPPFSFSLKPMQRIASNAILWDIHAYPKTKQSKKLEGELGIQQKLYFLSDFLLNHTLVLLEILILQVTIGVSEVKIYGGCPHLCGKSKSLAVLISNPRTDEMPLLCSISLLH